MTRIVFNFVARIRNLIVGFVPIFAAAIIAAVNTVTDRSPKGYAFAVGTAFLTVFVSPAFQSAELKAKVIPPTLDEQIAAGVEKALRQHAPAAPVVVDPTLVAVDRPAVEAVQVVDPAAPVH